MTQCAGSFFAAISALVIDIHVTGGTNEYESISGGGTLLSVVTIGSNGPTASDEQMTGRAQLVGVP
jgi:hypothetical protein